MSWPSIIIGPRALQSPFRPPQLPPPNRPPEVEGGACIRWGRASQFDDTSSIDRPRITFDWPDDEDEAEEEIITLDYQEVMRAVSEIRVENPEDSEQYVMVERIENITFRGPDGRHHRFILDHSDDA